MSEPGKDSGPSAFLAIALVGQLGLTVSVPIVVCAVAGKYLDTWLHGRGMILLALMLIGIGAGLYGAYRLLAKELRWKP